MLRVYLFRGRHPLYETFLTNPPEGVTYYPPAKAEGAEEYTLYNRSSTFQRMVIDDAFSSLGLPRLVPILRRYDLVHSSRGFIAVGPNKYVVDVEHAGSFVGMRHRRLRLSHVRNIIAKSLKSPRCHQILPHSCAALRSLEIISTNKEILDKSRVLYPAVGGGAPAAKVKNGNSPVVLYMGEYYWKGGREFLKACFELQKEQDFRVKYISLRVHPPDSVVKKARELIDIDYHEGPVPREHLLQTIYPSTDVFVMPTYIDTFGYAFLEAMSHGIPCIGTSHFAIPEIVEDGVTGFVVSSPISYFDRSFVGHPELPIEKIDCTETVNGLTSAMRELLDSESLRTSMGAEARKRIAQGKFSIGHRNKVLKEVYESCTSRAV